MLKNRRGLMHRIYFDGQDYFSERAVQSFLGVKNSGDFRDKFGRIFTFHALSIVQRNQLSDSGLAPESLRRSNGVLILCTDVEKYLESYSKSEVADAKSKSESDYKSDPDSLMVNSIEVPCSCKGEPMSPTNRGNDELICLEVHRCLICLAQFESVEKLQFHQTLTEHFYTVIKCDICSTTCLSEAELEDHVKAAHGLKWKHEDVFHLNTFRCIVEGCCSSFASGPDLYWHVAELHSNKLFICGTCFAMFRYREGLHFHTRRTQHETKLKKNRSVNNSSEAVILFRDDEKFVKRGLKQFPCDLCDKSFSFPITLQYHKRSCHQGSDSKLKTFIKCARNRGPRNPNLERRFKCQICSKTYTTYRVLWYHKKSHVNNGFFLSCRFCPQMFRSFKTRKRHEAIGHREEIGKPPGRTLNEKSAALKLTKVDDFKCRYCGMICASKTYLRDHEDKHNGVQRHKCDKCLKTFSYRSAYSRHQKYLCYKDDFKICCHLCGDKFRDNRGLKIHMTMSHTDAEKAEDI